MNDPLIGSHVGPYRIERMLGRGGMASIYFAWDTQNDRPVALKLLDERHRDAPSYVQRFINEAQAISSWQHPNIVRVYEAGEDQGIYYYAMEFIRGLDLAQLLRQYLDAGQLLPYAEVLRIGWAVSAALDFAHQRGIVHRDVKPSNILISVDGRVLLSDFGLVMDLNRGTLGETFGSPHYIAPEQARNSAGAVPQSDIYSLAVILYEALTGATPFDDPNPTTLALKHLTETPPLPRSLNPRLSPAVESVLLRGLMKTPRERYASGRELMSALDRALQSDIGTLADASVPLPLSPETVRFKAQRSQAPYSASMPGPPPAVQPQPQPRSGGVTQRAGAQPSPHYSPQAGPPPMGSGMPQGGYAQGGAPGGPGMPPPAAPQPRSRGFGLGCLGLALAGLLLAVGIGAVLAFNAPNFGFPPITGGNTATQDPVSALPTATASATVEVTVTFTPSLTFTATPEPSETPTLEPTPSLTPPPPTPTASATAVPPSPTVPPPPPSETPQPELRIEIIHVRDDGIVLVNTGETPFPLPALELWDNDVELEGTEWEVELLEPEQCVVAWQRNDDVDMPEGLECERVGEVVERQGRQRFWQRTMHVRYNGEEIAECRTNKETCEIIIP